MAKKNRPTKPESPETPAPPKARFPPHLVRFLWIFPLCLLVGFGLLLAPFMQPARDKSTNFLVAVTAASIRLFGGHAVAQNNFLRNPITGFSIEEKRPEE